MLCIDFSSSMFKYGRGGIEKILNIKNRSYCIFKLDNHSHLHIQHIFLVDAVQTIFILNIVYFELIEKVVHVCIFHHACQTIAKNEKCTKSCFHEMAAQISLNVGQTIDVTWHFHFILPGSKSSTIFFVKVMKDIKI